MKKFLIVGLGNIGDRYVETRHNVGFKVVDNLAEKLEVNFEPKKLGEVANATYRGKPITIVKPSTLMNLSGKTVKYYLEKENIPLQNLLVVTDDLNLPFGTLRMKGKGSDGGHNGLKDIQSRLGTTKYPRLRFGISDEFSKGGQVDYVLGEWSDEEREKLEERLDAFAKATLSFIHHGINNTMNKFNNN